MSSSVLTHHEKAKVSGRKVTKRSKQNGKPAPKLADTPSNFHLTNGATGSEKQEVAQRLTEMVSGRIKLEHCPYTQFTEGAPARVSIFTAYVEENTDDEREDFGDSLHVTIDDRLGDVRLQFIRELRRIASVFGGMAKLVEKQADPVEAKYMRLGSYRRSSREGKGPRAIS